MQANWSLVLNVLLLVGVILAIGRLMKARRRSLNPEPYPVNQGAGVKNFYDNPNHNDDIIAVRKIDTLASLDTEVEIAPDLRQSQPRLMPEEQEIEFTIEPKVALKIEPDTESEIPAMLMLFLLAKENRQFAGYELLQTILAAGLRFGEGHLFHRHQFSNGQGPVLCSLATATETGVFDLQNIGAFSVHGLCLYMHASKNPGIDKERFSIMLETARQLSEGLDAHLLDDQRKPLTEEGIARYHHLLQINRNEE